MSLDWIKLPNPYPAMPLEYRANIGGTVATGIGATRTWYIPFVFPCSATIYAINGFCETAGASGNYDLGFYQADGTTIQTLGSTRAAVGKLTMTLTNDFRVTAGQLYYGAIASNSTSPTYYMGQTDGTTVIYRSRLAVEHAFPCPTSSATFATPNESFAIMPYLNVNVR